MLAPTGSKAPPRVTILTDSVLAVRSGGRETGGSSGTFEDLIDRIDGSPLRALRLAAESKSLRWAHRGQRFGIAFDV